MRKSLVLILGLVGLVGEVYANDVSMWFGIGQGKEDISMEVGISYKNFGANIYNAGDYDYSKDEVIDSPPPHTQYRVEKDKRVGGTIGLDLMYILPLGMFRPFVEGGLTIVEKRDLAISTNILDKGAIYTLDKKTRLGVAGGAGLQVEYKHFLAGIELHTEKGILGQIGINF